MTAGSFVIKLWWFLTEEGCIAAKKNVPDPDRLSSATVRFERINFVLWVLMAWSFQVLIDARRIMRESKVRVDEEIILARRRRARKRTKSTKRLPLKQVYRKIIRDEMLALGCDPENVDDAEDLYIVPAPTESTLALSTDSLEWRRRAIKLIEAARQHRSRSRTPPRSRSSHHEPSPRGAAREPSSREREYDRKKPHWHNRGDRHDRDRDKKW